jgi:hypothetical protein
VFAVGPSEASWRSLAGLFNLTPHRSIASYSPGINFRRLKRALGFPSAHLPPSFDDWHHGRWNGIEVLILTYTQGSGSSQTTYTGVIARVDPPLFLGIAIRAKPILELFAPTPFQTGDAFVDQHLRISGFDKRRVTDFLALGTLEGRDFITRVVRNVEQLAITDSLVCFSTQGYEIDPGQIRWQLDTVTYLANVLARRRATFPRTEAEVAQQATWRRFADERGLTMDPARMTIFGQHEGAHLKIALESESQEIHTSVNVRFPHSVHVAFLVKRTGLPGLFQGLFGQDIKIGDDIFDEQYLVTGQPEPLVRQALAKPELLHALKSLGAVTDEVQLNHAQLFFRVKGACSSPNELASICETGRIAMNAFFAQVQNIGPYR